MNVTKYLSKVINLSFGLLTLLIASFANAGWIDWTSSTTGTMDIGSQTIGVTLTGSPYGYENGDYHYNNHRAGYTSPSGTYGGLAPTDLIRVYRASPFTLHFDQTVYGLDMALVSVGQGGLPVTYDFNNDFSVTSYGANYWGYGNYSIIGDDFIGREFNGILRFEGEFDSISFSTNTDEYWHAFNFGSSSLSRVIEPSNILLMGLGLVGLMLSRRAQN